MRFEHVKMFTLVLAALLFAGCEDKNPVEPRPQPNGEHLWSQRFGDENYQNSLSVAIDPAGNVVVVGEFQGTVDFGGGKLTSAGNCDIFVAKFNSSGSHLWSQRFGDAAGNQRDPQIAIDATGNVVVAGWFDNTVDFGGGILTSAGGHDIFVAKFAPDGSYFWSKDFGDGYDQWATGVAIDAAGNVVVPGGFQGTVNFGGGELTSAGDFDIFVVKFTSDGSYLWSKSFGDTLYQRPTNIAIDAARNVVLTGYFDGTVDFGGDSLESKGYSDIFMAKFASDGSHLWSNSFGDKHLQFPEGVAMDHSGNIVLTGGFTGTVDFGGGTLTSAGDFDIFVVKFTSGGFHLWGKRFGGVYHQFGAGIATDAAGNVVVGGYIDGTVDFGGGALTSAGDYDIFVARFTSGGTHLWSKNFGDADVQILTGVAVDATGKVLATGWFRSTVNFGGGTLTSAGEEDVFVAKFGP